MIDARRKLREIANPPLKTAGFCSKGLTWNRRVGETIQVINFQTSRYLGESRTDFTVNLGLCCPKVWSLTWGNDEPSVYNETDCCPRFRIGYILANEEPKHRDIWWTVEDDDETVVREIIDVVVERCIPFLDSHSNLSAMQSVASKFTPKMAIADKIYLAVLNHLLGHVKERDALFAELLSMRSTSWRDRIEKVLQRLGLL